MTKLKNYWLAGSALALVATGAYGKTFTIAPGDLDHALNVYQTQSGVVLALADDSMHGIRTAGVRGELSDDQALLRLLKGTGFTYARDQSGVVAIVPQEHTPVRVAQAAPRRAPVAPMPAMPAAVETVVVTAQHKSENIQQVPIAITALSQQQLTERQIAGGPDLVKEVPNLTFSKTNFSGYNLEIRGIGTQAISVTTDPAVAVAFNDIPFIRNHFFEQEFYDLGDVEVLRGPQGTLYGRNATAGVVNIKSALPTDSYEAMGSADLGNYNNRRLEGMINLPIVGDTLDLRIAGEWTKRDGYSTNELTGSPIDGRDLWSGRVTLGWKPASNVQAYLVWEHFQEDDDRMRTAKQLCKTDPNPTEFLGVPVPSFNATAGGGYSAGDFVSQGCEMTSLYSADAFEVPNGYTLPYYSALTAIGVPLSSTFDPYASTTQSRNLRDIESSINPVYRAKNDVLEFNADYTISPALTITSQTGFNRDFLWSTEDYNRFNTQPGAFQYVSGSPTATRGIILPDPNGLGVNNEGAVCSTPGGYGCTADGVFCDPQLGCSDRLVAQDLSEEHAWQLSQEFRLSSNFSGPFNFSVGANFLHYETEENYYVFINTLTLASAVRADGNPAYIPGVSDNQQCLQQGYGGFIYHNPHNPVGGLLSCVYIDPNPISSVNGQGHNYFVSQNPYVLNSYAGFGEAYYKLTDDLKLTAGLRWTDDQKHFIDIPSELVINGYGYPSTGVVNQQWSEPTGRVALNWTPGLDFTDQTLVYLSAAHGYKAGGANPPGAELLKISDNIQPDHPLTFKPEYIEAFEMGTKNTLLNGALTLNGDIFYYNYSNYQISEIVDRTAINNNYNAHVEGAEFEGNWEPLPGLKFNLAQGFESTAMAGGDQGIDLMDRAAGHPGWVVVKPLPTAASNCVMPAYVLLYQALYSPGGIAGDCDYSYFEHIDPVLVAPYVPNPPFNYYGNPIPPGVYPGFDPLAGTPGDPYTGQNTYHGVDYGPAPNNGEGFSKNLAGNQLPNAPHFTTSLTAEYSMPMSEDWLATLHADFYWQSQSWARVFEDPIDKLHGYSTTNLALTLTSANGWQVMAYVKNVFDVTAITGTFLNSDDSGLTTNVFLTDPRLYGVRVTKQLDQGDGFWGSDYSGYDFFTGLFSDTDGGKPPLWIELGGQMEAVHGLGDPVSQPYMQTLAQDGFASPVKLQRALDQSFGEEGTVSFQPDGSDWIYAASVRYGRTSTQKSDHEQTNNTFKIIVGTQPVYVTPNGPASGFVKGRKFEDVQVSNNETHAIVDFSAGTDVGLGSLNSAAESTLSVGVRFVQFSSSQNLSLHADPDFKFPTTVSGPETHTTIAAMSHINRSFHGAGPSFSWKGSLPLDGDLQSGEIDLDLGANGALLFGRQKVRGHHQTTSSYYKSHLFFGRYSTNTTAAAANQNRSKSVIVPNLGGFAGVSWTYRNAKVSFGYRADEFFGAIDGGIDTHRSENVGFFGPFANISIGLGG
jgi:iron complex outermembrane receptor protein